ncbi:hypothetical protein [Streptomyces sp. NPDC058953]|uniref:hypothetical protein n=1 Tax=unclassified Streptomyces TaxID=2593676 RepID=UPI00369F200A
MPASERDTAPRPPRRHRPPQPPSMRDLLASCAAATAVSTPPRIRDDRADASAETGDGHPPARRDAA